MVGDADRYHANTSGGQVDARVAAVQSFEGLDNSVTHGPESCFEKGEFVPDFRLYDVADRFANHMHGV